MDESTGEGEYILSQSQHSNEYTLTDDRIECDDLVWPVLDTTMVCVDIIVSVKYVLAI